MKEKLTEILENFHGKEWVKIMVKQKKEYVISYGFQSLPKMVILIKSVGCNNWSIEVIREGRLTNFSFNIVNYEDVSGIISKILYEIY